MFFTDINYITVIIAAAVSIGLGFLWYSPVLFGKRWMKEMDFTPEGLEELKKTNSAKGMARTYTLTSAFALVTAFVIAALLNSLIVASLGGLILLAILLWLAFSMPVLANQVFYGGDSLVLFAINSGYQLAAILLSTLIIGIFG